MLGFSSLSLSPFPSRCPIDVGSLLFRVCPAVLICLDLSSVQLRYVQRRCELCSGDWPQYGRQEHLHPGAWRGYRHGAGEEKESVAIFLVRTVHSTWVVVFFEKCFRQYFALSVDLSCLSPLSPILPCLDDFGFFSSHLIMFFFCFLVGTVSSGLLLLSFFPSPYCCVAMIHVTCVYVCIYIYIRFAPLFFFLFGLSTVTVTGGELRALRERGD